MEANHAIVPRIVVRHSRMHPCEFGSGRTVQCERSGEPVAGRGTRSHASLDVTANGSGVTGEPSTAHCSAVIRSTDRGLSVAC
jgi:hypothetical protein